MAVESQQRRRSAGEGPVVLISNPHAGHAQDREHLTRLLADTGVHVGLQVGVSDLYEHQPQGQAWREAGFTAAIAAGGDGTIGTVATHLAGSDLPLGILPMGTANDVARSLAIPLDLAAACQVIAAGKTRLVDAGQVAPALTKPGVLAVRGAARPPQGEDAPRPGAGAYFLHAATLGLNVEFARLAGDADRRARLRGLTYPASALAALARFRPLRTRIRIPADAQRPADAAGGAEAPAERVIECTVLTVLSINTPAFAGPLGLRVPGVVSDDRLLDFVVIEAPERVGLRERVEQLCERMGWLFERPPEGGAERDEAASTGAWANIEQAPVEPVISLPGLHHFRARSLVIETDEPADLTMDGEVRAHTPARVCVAPEPVPIFVPA